MAHGVRLKRNVQQFAISKWSTAPAVVDPNTGVAAPADAPFRVSENKHGDVFTGLGQPATALAARHHRDCVGGVVLLLCLFRQQPHQTRVT